jgi:hypothetical protein
MDEDLRNSLWNVLDALVWSQTRSSSVVFGTFLSDNLRHRSFAHKIWGNFFKCQRRLKTDPPRPSVAEVKLTHLGT